MGHQCYPHKVLTRPRKQFATRRTYGGASGFLKREESEYDVFNAGHASRSISPALGMAAARDLHGDNHRVVAIIGDGGLTGGMAMEAPNQAGFLGRRLMIILNDNEMSVSPSVGGLRGYLNRLIQGQPCRRCEDEIEQVPLAIPRAGEDILKFAREAERTGKQLLVSRLRLEELGFTYVGPINGHSLPQLLATLRGHRDDAHPVLVPVTTRKGKGSQPAEKDPVFWHGATPVSVETGEVARGTTKAPSFQCSPVRWSSWRGAPRRSWRSPRPCPRVPAWTCLPRSFRSPSSTSGFASSTR